MPVLCYRRPTPTRWMSAIGTSVWICAAGIGPTPALAQAAATARDADPALYDLSAAPLRQTVAAIARASGLAIGVEPSVPAAQMAAPVRGRLSVEQALVQALSGTGLVITPRGAGWQVTAASAPQSVVILAARDPAETGFKADRSDTATRSGTDLMDVPMSVTIVTAKVLQSQQATSTLEALRNVSGVGLAQSPQGRPVFSIRGFGETSQTTNGIADRSAAQTDISTVERIEVLKGPQAILAGGDSLGGGVNVVTKRPTPDSVREAGLQFGTGSDHTVSADVGGALSDDRRWSYRIIASTQNSGRTDAGFDGRRGTNVAPALRYADGTTDLTIGFAESRGRLPTPTYTFATADGRIAPTPTVRLGSTDDGFDNVHQRVGYQWERKLSDSLTLVSRLQRVRDELKLHLWSPFFLSTATDGSVSGFFGAISDDTDSHQLSGDHYARLRVQTGPLAHKLSIGFGHDAYRSSQVQYEGEVLEVPLYPAQPTTLPDPRAGAQNPVMSDVSQRQRAVYLQDLITLGDWNVMLNLRRTRYALTNTFTTASSVQTFDPVTIGVTTPGGGVVYRWSDDTSLYASYSEGFVPQTVPLCGGGIAPPLQSRNQELGAKFQFAEGRVSLTSALYQIDQTNSPVTVFPTNCVEVRPSRKTRGIELDSQGELMPGWNMMLNYTYASVSDALDPQAPATGVPRHKLGLWTTYKPGWQRLAGWGLGLGLSASSRMAGNSDPAEPFDIPGQAQIDASVFYDQAAWSLTFGIKNVADRRLYGAAVSNVFVPVLPGREYLLTLQHRFD